MLRFLRKVNLRNKFLQLSKCRNFSSSPDKSKSTGTRRFILSVIASAGVGFAGAVIYGKYDSKFKEFLENNVPYADYLYTLIKTSDALPQIEKDKAIDIVTSNEDFEVKSLEQKVLKQLAELAKSSNEISLSHNSAIEKIKNHTKCLIECLKNSDDEDKEVLLENVKKAYLERINALKMREATSANAQNISKVLSVTCKKLQDPFHPLKKSAETLINALNNQFLTLENELNSVVSDELLKNSQDLIRMSKEQLLKELVSLSPESWKNKAGSALTEDDMKLIVRHAHEKIESLLKKLAEQEVNEAKIINDAINQQKFEDKKIFDLKLKEELLKHPIDLNEAYFKTVKFLIKKIEMEAQQQLVRQTAAHIAHVQQVLKDQKEDLNLKHQEMLTDKLYQQKHLFTLELSENIARLNNILSFLESKSHFDQTVRQTQNLWVACQTANQKLNTHNAGNPYSPAEDIAAIQAVLEENNQFAQAVIESIPPEALSKGVYNRSILKERFTHVNKSCRRVALIDENNDSLYRYLISYLQSLFILDSPSVPKAELDGKVAVDPAEWDTFAILNRVSYSLRTTDLEQALRYANQLKGEPRAVASDWIKEVRLLLETQLAIKALLAHAAALTVQGCH